MFAVAILLLGGPLAFAVAPAASAKPARTTTNGIRGCEKCGLADRIARAAMDAPAQVQDGRLYAYRIWAPVTKAQIGPLTYEGFLSCAIVVSAILKEGGRDIGKKYSVDGVAQALRAWRTIKSVDDLLPGDVVFWRATATKAAWFWRLGIYRRGRYPQHVGIYVGKDAGGQPMTVDNNSSTGKPEKTSLARLGNDFRFAKRPP